MTLETVGDLIDRLEKLGRDKLLIVDVDGNTYNLDSEFVDLWDENDEGSPVAIYAQSFCDEW